MPPNPLKIVRVATLHSTLSSGISNELTKRGFLLRSNRGRLDLDACKPKAYVLAIS
jgi:hypothetical protein